jgi:outer membrane protein OmpA-like peptidoglycan-associated protein
MSLAKSKSSTASERKNAGHTARVQAPSGHPLEGLHRTVGNHAVQRMLKSAAAPPAVQMKSAVDTPGDALEQEADRAADQVTQTSGAGLQRACSCGGTCSSCQAGGVPAAAQDGVHSPGHPLDPSTRAFMEPRFGHDFSGVRVHTGEQANRSARSVNALAYTLGSDIVFGSERYNPSSGAGRRLLAHELAHVVQQSQGPPRVQRFVDCTPANMFGDECPPRQTGEARKAHHGDMMFLDYHDPFDQTSGGLIANFDIGSATIKPNLGKTIDWKQFVRKIKRNRSHWNLVGFTDCQGDEKLNTTLREQRAKAVFNILPPSVQAQIDSVEGAHISQCVRDNTTPAARTLNRSVLLQLVSYTADFSSETNEIPLTPSPDVDTKDCSQDKHDKVALAFRFARMMVDKAISVIDHMEKGTPEEALLLKYFGKDAWDSRDKIRRTYRRMQRDWNPNLTFRCETGDDKDKTVTIAGKQYTAEGDCHSGTEGLTGVIPLVSGGHVGSILVCDSAFTTNILPETDLPETILHEISHASEWTFDNGYCDRANGCSLDTDEAIHNGDSYSGFAGEALSTWGPE